MLSSSAWIRQIGTPSTSTRVMDSFGSSLVAATRCLVTLHAGNPATLTSFNASRQLLVDGVAHLRHRQPVEDLTEEALDQHPLGDRPRDAAARQVEEVFRVDRPDGRAMTAAQDVVVEAREDRVRCRLRLIR